MTTAHTNNFAGMTVVAFESRMAAQMTTLITRHGGRAVVAPAMRELPLTHHTEALAFGARVMAGDVDILVLLTGVGTRALVDIWQTRHTLEAIRHALAGATLVCRGPKPVAALKALGLTATLAVPEPHTWQATLHALDASLAPDGFAGRRVAIQEYGVSNADLATALTERGAHVTSVPVYRWALPEDIEPLTRALRHIREGQAAAVLFTSAAQTDHIVDVLHAAGDLPAFREALAHTMVASIGPVTSQRLRHHDFPVDLEPTQSKMGVLVQETAARVGDVLRRKRPA